MQYARLGTVPIFSKRTHPLSCILSRLQADEILTLCTPHGRCPFAAKRGCLHLPDLQRWSSTIMMNVQRKPKSARRFEIKIGNMHTSEVQYRCLAWIIEESLYNKTAHGELMTLRLFFAILAVGDRWALCRRFKPEQLRHSILASFCHVMACEK